MQRQSTFLLFFLVTALTLAGCATTDLSLIVGRGAVALEEIGEAKSYYNFRMGLREYQGKAVYLHGRRHNYNGVAVVVKSGYRSYPFSAVDVILWNTSKEPQKVYPDELSLVAPDGRRFSYSSDEHIRRRIEYGASAAMLVSETIQPGMHKEVTLYFETGGADPAGNNWTIRYSPQSWSIFVSPEPIHVLARPVYSLE